MISRTQRLIFWTLAMDLQTRLLKVKTLDLMATRTVLQRSAQTNRYKVEVSTTITLITDRLWLRSQLFMPRDQDLFSINLGKQIFKFTINLTILFAKIQIIIISWAQTLTTILIMEEDQWATLVIWIAIMTISRVQDSVVFMVLVPNLERLIFRITTPTRTTLNRTIITKVVCPSRTQPITKLTEELCLLTIQITQAIIIKWEMLVTQIIPQPPKLVITPTIHLTWAT